MKTINRIRPAYLNGGHVRPHLFNGDPSPFDILCCASLNLSCCTGGREEVCEALLTGRLLGSLPIHWANALQFQSGMQKCGATAISCYSPLHSFHQLRTAFKYLRLLLVNLLIFSRNLTLALLSALRTSTVDTALDMNQHIILILCLFSGGSDQHWHSEISWCWKPGVCGLHSRGRSNAVHSTQVVALCAVVNS